MSHALPEPRRRALRTFTAAWTITCVALGCLCTWQVLRLQDGADKPKEGAVGESHEDSN